jgi:hypothetical protein
LLLPPTRCLMVLLRGCAGRRRDWPADADIWSFRRDWQDERQRLKAALLSGRFCFGLLQRVTKADGSEADLWSARDALVLKALTLVLARVLPVSPRCTHIKGNGGAKAAVRQVRAALATNRFVLRTDVKSSSIDHLWLIDRLALYIREPTILNLLCQYLRRRRKRRLVLGLRGRDFARLSVEPADRGPSFLHSPDGGDPRRFVKSTPRHRRGAGISGRASLQGGGPNGQPIIRGIVWPRLFDYAASFELSL